jgi:hypothetical protein
MWAKYVAWCRFVVDHRRFTATNESQRQGSSIPRMTFFYSVGCIIASEQCGNEAQTIYEQTFYNRLCSCFTTGPVKLVPRTDPRHISLDLMHSLPSRPNRLFTSMLKVLTTLFPSLVTSVWVLKTQEGWGAKEEYRQVSFYAIFL